VSQSSFRTHWRHLRLACIALSLQACTGSVRDNAETTDGNGGNAGGGGDQANNGGDGGTGDTNQAGNFASPPEIAVSGTRYPRLSHAQWENTVRDLLRLPSSPGLSSKFSPDARGGGDFDNDVATMQVTPNLWIDLQSASEGLAKQIASDPAKLAKLMPPGIPASGDARTRGFLSDLARRAYRRRRHKLKSMTW
jgi:hypothetical protein